jgi:hypothetical protein
MNLEQGRGTSGRDILGLILLTIARFLDSKSKLPLKGERLGLMIPKSR